VDGVPYLIDAGPGVGRQIALAGFELPRVRTIFITHHHIDHDAGLASLMSLTWFDAAWDDQSLPPIQIYGPPATQFLARAALDYLSVSERIFRAGAPELQPAATMFQAHDIHRDGQFYRDARIAVRAAENSHYYFKSGSALTGRDMSFSYRFDTPNGSVVFTGDTGPSQAVTELARNADVLVSEVCLCDARAKVHPKTASPAGAQIAAALEKEETFHMSHEHLTPEEVGKLAATAHAKVVILTHFVPGDGKIDPTRFTAGVMKYFPGPVIPATDLFEYDLR
jgi:ribonuclease BN (tRNA processing enzyme)